MQAATAAPVGGLVLVRLGAGRVGIDLPTVVEVLRPPVLTRVPWSPGWLAGMANWRGRMLAVLDLGDLLAGAPTAGPVAPGRLLVLQEAGRVAGLLADCVEGAADLAGGEATAVPPTLPASAARLLRGQVSRPGAGAPVALLDVPAVLALREELTAAPQR